MKASEKMVWKCLEQCSRLLEGHFLFLYVFLQLMVTIEIVEYNSSYIGMKGVSRMNEHFSTKTINGIPTHFFTTKKFKTNHIGLYIRQPLEEEHFTKVALIPSILKRGTEKHPSTKEMRQALDQLYGASLQADVMKRGEQQIAVFRLEMANEKFLSDQAPLLEKGMELLADLILRPLTENGGFSSKYVELEKDLFKKKS